MPSLMKALVYENPRVMNIRQVEVPVPKEGEVLIRVERAGICGSELSGYLGHNSLRVPPLVMGHEFSGTIAAVGPQADRFQSGDRVTANPLVSCGGCSYCRNGAQQLCGRRRLLGAHLPGAYAEYVVVPEKNVYLLPDHVSFDDGALVEPFACAVRICRLLRLDPGDRLLIMGAGPIGLLVLQAARIYGLHHISVVDLNEERLAIAAELGAEVAVSVDSFAEYAAGGKFDKAVDAVGLEATRSACVQAVRAQGQVVFSGLHKADSSLPINTAIRDEIAMFGAFAYNVSDFEAALKWIVEGRIRMLPWTLHAPLEDGTACFEKLLTRPGKVAKILLTLGE